jgi:hypothetical protein
MLNCLQTAKFMSCYLPILIASRYNSVRGDLDEDVENQARDHHENQQTRCNPGLLMRLVIACLSLYIIIALLIVYAFELDWSDPINGKLSFCAALAIALLAIIGLWKGLTWLSEPSVQRI